MWSRQALVHVHLYVLSVLTLSGLESGENAGGGVESARSCADDGQLELGVGRRAGEAERRRSHDAASAGAWCVVRVARCSLLVTRCSLLVAR